MITVFICTYNRGSLIDATLYSIIEEQTLVPDEIVVVNGGGENDCEATLLKWQIKFPKLREIKTINKNLASSRNVGLPECKGDLILQTDDDARVFPDWVEKMKAAHRQHPEAGVIGGEVVDASGDSLLSKVADVTTFPRFKEVKEVRTVPGVNSSYKKAVIQKLGDYDTSLSRGEDVDYNWRAIQAGWKVLYLPEIKVYHVHRASWKGLLNQHYMYGRSYFEVRKKWPEMYCIYPRKVNNIKSLFKIGYFFIHPIVQAKNKIQEFHGSNFKKMLAFIAIVAIYYGWQFGVMSKMVKSKRNKNQ